MKIQHAAKYMVATLLVIATLASAFAASGYWYDDYRTVREPTYKYSQTECHGYTDCGHYGYGYAQISYNYPSHYTTGARRYNNYKSPYSYGSGSYRSYYGDYRNSYNYRTGPRSYYGGYAGSYNYRIGNHDPVLFDGYTQQWTGYNRYY